VIYKNLWTEISRSSLSFPAKKNIALPKKTKPQEKKEKEKKSGLSFSQSKAFFSEVAGGAIGI